MPGGLIQLLTIGTQDAPLILNPEITFFKTVYRKHTNFSLEQIIKYIGAKNFNTLYQYKINNLTDLLGGLHFIIDFPYTDVIKKVTTNSSYTSTLEINELSVVYDNLTTYLLFDLSSNSYSLVPQTFFNLSSNDEYYNQVSGVELQNNLLAGLNLLTTQNYGNLVNVFQLKESKLNQLLPYLRLYFNQWVEFWLKIFDKNQDFIYFTNIVSQLNYVSELSKDLELVVYDGYVNYNVFNKFRNLLNFKDEILDYFSNNTILETNPIYDTDFASNYAINNSLTISTYTYNALQYNSLVYLFLLQSLYSDFSSIIKGYTFWKKYYLLINNKVDLTQTYKYNNYFLEWTNKINIYNNTSFGNFESLAVEIYETYNKKYFVCEQNIVSLYTGLNLNSKEKTWCILKAFYNQFTDNSSNVICFDDHFNPNSTVLGLNYNINKIFFTQYSSLSTVPNMNTTWTNFDDPAFIQPVDLSLMYPYLTYKLTDSVINLNYFIDNNFFVTLRNKINIAFFFRVASNLDNYYSEKQNNNTFQNTFLELNDVGQTVKTLTFYHNINVNKNIKVDILREEMNKIFNMESFYGTFNNNTNDLSANFILAASYINDLSYNIVNQNMEITDENQYIFDISSNVVTISNWNNTAYQKVFVGINGGYMQIYDFEFSNNNLIIRLPLNLTLSLDNNKIKLKMVKQILIPVIDFVPDIDFSGNVNYPNISFNISSYPDVSFNLINYPDIKYNKYICYSTENNIVLTNNLTYDNFDINKFYELKITNFDNSINRFPVIFDGSTIVPSLNNLDLSQILEIDLLEFDYGLNRIAQSVTFTNNYINTQYIGTIGKFYWLIALRDTNNNLIPKTNFIPVRFDGTHFIVYGITTGFTWDLYEISNTFVPNLFPLLYHYLNTDASGNINNYQLNSNFYQQPYILNTFYKYLVRDQSGHLLDASGNLIDNSGNVVDINDNRIILDGSKNILSWVLDSSGYTINTSGYIVDVNQNLIPILDNSGNRITNLKATTSPPGIIKDLLTNFILRDSLNNLSIVTLIYQTVFYYQIVNNISDDSFYPVSYATGEPGYYNYIGIINNIGNIVDLSGNRIILDGSGNMLQYTFNIEYSINADGYLVDPSNNQLAIYQPNGVTRATNLSGTTSGLIYTDTSNFVLNDTTNNLYIVTIVQVQGVNRGLIVDSIEQDIYYSVSYATGPNLTYKYLGKLDINNNIVDANNNRIILDGSSNMLLYTYKLGSVNSDGNLDISGNIYQILNSEGEHITDLSGTANGLIYDSNGNYILSDNTNNLFIVKSQNKQVVINATVVSDNFTDRFYPVVYKIGPGLYYKYQANIEPIYYFYNIPSSDYTIKITLNNLTVNKLCPINASEFYRVNGKGVPIVFDFINLNTPMNKQDIIINYNNTFDSTFLEDETNIISLLENTNSNYENLYLDLISTLEKLGNTISNTIDNSILINNLNLQNYNSYDFNSYSLLVPDYYNLTATQIASGLGIQKFKIANKGKIFTQGKQKYSSSAKISSDLTNYLRTVSQTLVNNINSVKTNQNLLNVYNQNQYSNSYNPRYILENTVNTNLYDISSYTLVTEWSLNGFHSDNSTEIYFQNSLIDVSTNNIATGKGLVEVSERNTYRTNIHKNYINDFDDNIFNYLGAVHFENKNFVFFDNYSFNNPSDFTLFLLDDNSVLSFNNIIKDDLKIYYNSYEFRVTNQQILITQNPVYVYKMKIDVSSNTISGNSFLINNLFYTFEIVNGYYIITSNQELDIKNRYIICGTSEGSIDTFLATNVVYVVNYHIYNNFKTNIYLGGLNNEKIISKDSSYMLLDFIQTSSITYYSYYSNSYSEVLYNISNKYLIPPFRFSTGTISLANDNKDFIINNFSENSFYKLDKNIISGNKLKLLDISGNYNLWVYPNKNLKLVKTNITVTVNNGIITFSSINNLSNYTYYYINGYVYYIEILANNYQINNFLSENISNVPLYILHDDNFREREQQYISIIDNSSVERIIPYKDLSSNNIYFNNARIYSNYYYNSEYLVSDNEFDIIMAFSYDGSNNFMKPLSLIYDISGSNTTVSITNNTYNYRNFLFYSTSGLVYTLNYGGVATSFSCDDANFIILNGTFNNTSGSRVNFTVNDVIGFKKYKINVNTTFGTFYSFVWVLKIDVSMYNNYLKLFGLQSIYESCPINVYSNPNQNVNLFLINEGYQLEGNNPLIFLNNSYITFRNVSTNSARQQIYYHSSILNKNKITKLNLNYETTDDFIPDLNNIGSNLLTDGSLIYFKNPDVNLKYIILKNQDVKYFRTVTSVDSSNGIIYLNKKVFEDNYILYGSIQNIIFMKNDLYIYFNNNNYYISSYEKCNLRQGDIILLGKNIFEIIGLNSFTMFYDLNPLEIYNVKNYYNGFYLLYRLNSTPKLPKNVGIVDFTLSDSTNYKLTVNLPNIQLLNSPDNFSIQEGDNVFIYVKGTKLYNVFNYVFKNNDSVIYNSTVYRITLMKDKEFYLMDNTNTIINLGLLEGYYSFYVPYQPCKMDTVVFDISGNILNNYDTIIYYEKEDGIFYPNNISTNLVNQSIYTRIIDFGHRFINFDQSIIYNAFINGNQLTFEVDLSDYLLYFNQPIKVNSHINYIQDFIYPNIIVIDKVDYDISKNVKVLFGKKNIQELFSTYQLDKSCYLKPMVNLNKYHYYDISNNVLLNYDISENLTVTNKTIFADNVFNLDISNNMLNLDNSYHILLEKNAYNQYISHPCKIILPNIIFFFNSGVDSYNSEFFIDKIYPINLNIDNSFSYKDIIIYKQINYPLLPYNQLIIWKKFDLKITGLVENLPVGFRVQIDASNITDYIGKTQFYIDKTILCQVLFDNTDQNYYLVTKNFLENFSFIYIKNINYVKSLTKYNYNTKVTLNNNFQKDFGLENVKLPTSLSLVGGVDYNYYSLNTDIDLLKNSYNLNAGFLNLQVVNYYFDVVLNKRIITTNDVVIKPNNLYVNNLPTNIFDESRIYLDGPSSVLRIFADTKFIISSLFNPIKRWDTWSLVGNIDISKNVMSQGNFYMDLSGTITRDISNVYFTKSEERDISGFLSSNLSNYDIVLEIKSFETNFYSDLPRFIGYNNFWTDPITYINSYIQDLSFNMYFDGTQLFYNGLPAKNFIINNQYDLSFNGNLYFLTRQINNVYQEINNLINNNYTDNLYGVRIDDVLVYVVGLSNNKNTLNDLFNFSSKCVNFADLILNWTKNQLYSGILDVNQLINNLRTALSVQNFNFAGLDVANNVVTYDSSFNNCLFLTDYPYNATTNLYQTSIPYNINYNIDSVAGLYPYKIMLENESYASSTIYEIEFLEGDNLNTLFSIDYPIIYNNQIEFFGKEDFDINLDFTINGFKSYDISSSSLIGYAYQLDMTAPDLSTLNLSLFTSIKYKNDDLDTFNSYLIFPNYISYLSSFIQAETNVGIVDYNIIDQTTYVTLLKINQVFNATSEQYSMYFESNNQKYRVDDIYEKNVRIRGVVNTFINCKLILTIKPTSVIYNNSQLYHLNLAEPLINYSYYYDLKNVPKNFLINDIIYPNDMNFLGDKEINALINVSDISGSFNNIVHYFKVGEFPPEPVQKISKKDQFLYEFNDTPSVIGINSCFLVYDLSYNSVNSDEYIQNFLNNLSSQSYYLSSDVIKQTNSTQFVINQFISNEGLLNHTFGGVINQWFITQFTYINEKLRFYPPSNFVFDANYSYYIDNDLIDMINFFYGNADPVYLTNGYIEIDVKLNLPFANVIFKQVIIEKLIFKPVNNQVALIELIDPIDVRFDGYLEVLDKKGTELGDYIYSLGMDISYNFIETTTIYFNSTNIIEGNVLCSNPLYVISKTLLENINSIYIKETNTVITNFTLELVQKTYVPFNLYKKVQLGIYSVFMNENELDFLDTFNFNINNLNKYYLISKFAKYNIQKRFNTQIMTPSPNLVPVNSNPTVVSTTIEKVKFVDNFYRMIFDYIEFWIGDQLVEQLNKDVLEIQYQFFKDDQKRKQLMKIITPYFTSDSVKLMIPLEFWFNLNSSLYLPLLCLNYTMVSLKFKLSDFNNLVINGPNNSTSSIKYSFVSVPEININLNIDGVILDTPERELFGNNQHEYMIERFKTYPVSLIKNVNDVSRMKFKNLVKDIFFITEVISTGARTYTKDTIIYDTYTKNYKYVRELYNKFIINGEFTVLISPEYNKDFAIIKQDLNEIQLGSERYTYFMQSPILSTQDPEYFLYLDSKYQTNLDTLGKKRANLELYFYYNYKAITKTQIISPIINMNISAAGIDLFTMINTSYLNLVVPYERYFNSVEPGYYAYCFALYPLDKQPSGHVNFTTLDDITVNTENNSLVTTNPFLLKTSVREYQILRIMSGMGALAWFD